MTSRSPRGAAHPGNGVIAPFHGGRPRNRGVKDTSNSGGAINFGSYGPNTLYVVNSSFVNSSVLAMVEPYLLIIILLLMVLAF